MALDCPKLSSQKAVLRFTERRIITGPWLMTMNVRKSKTLWTFLHFKQHLRIKVQLFYHQAHINQHLMQTHHPAFEFPWTEVSTATSILPSLRWHRDEPTFWEFQSSTQPWEIRTSEYSAQPKRLNEVAYIWKLTMVDRGLNWKQDHVSVAIWVTRYFEKEIHFYSYTYDRISKNTN